MNIYIERERLGGAVDCLCVPQPPYLELHLKAQDLYLKYQEPYLKYQQLFYMISSVSWHVHDFCSKYEECIDLIANVEGTHQT